MANPGEYDAGIMLTRWARTALGGAVLAAVGAGATRAEAFPEAGKGTPGAVVATACAIDNPFRCMRAEPMTFAKKVELPIAFDLDTGWIPDNSPLQVRFFAKLPAYSQVQMQAGLLATWPEAIKLDPFGLRGTGRLDFDYGLDIGGKAKAHVTIAGKDINWEGDIPGVPKVDFHVKGSRVFDPWAFDPGTLATGYTDKLTIFQVDLTDAIIPVPGVGGGIELDVQGELGVRYTTERVVITPANGTVTSTVSGVIDGPDKTAVHQWQQGAWGEYLVHPEGTMNYGGTLHLIPSFYIELLGKKIAIPVYDYPYEVDIAEQAWVFDDQLVHVPLPDIRGPEMTTLSAPAVVVGQQAIFAVPVKNVGEAPLHIEATTDSTAFKVIDAYADVAPGTDAALTVRFSPKQTGALTGKLTLSTNDPDQPTIVLDLDGTGQPEPPPIEPPDPPPTAGSGGAAGGSGAAGSGAGDKPSVEGVDSDGGCGCRAAPMYGSSGWPGALVAALVLGGRRTLRAARRGGRS